MRLNTRKGLVFVALATAGIFAVAIAGATPRSFGPISFLTGPQEGEPLDLALSYIENHRAELGLTPADLGEMIVKDNYPTRHNGTTHIYIRQRLGGIEVWNGDININVARDGSIINLGSRFIPDLAGKANTASPVLSDVDAVAKAAEHFGLDPAGTILLAGEGGPDRRATFANDRLSRDPIPVQLMYFPADDGSVRLTWQTVLNLVDSQDWWQVQVDATTGEILNQYNYTNYDSYWVVPYPPNDNPEESGGLVQVDDPADPVASPFGWHDTDGDVDPDFTDTQGNNVDAHDDLDADNLPGIRPDGDTGGDMLEFFFAWDPDLPPDGGTNLEAAIVNLYYSNNVMHDLTYRYGFDEPAGNFQFNTYGNGGAGNDHVLADAQDGSGTNNANFATPPDGLSGRMQMFRWLSPLNSAVDINTPPSIAGTYSGAIAGFGPALDNTGITADMELANDGTDTATDGCEPLIGFTPGNIALIDRGTCEFGVKVLNAEQVGAVGVVVANDRPGILTMGAGAVGDQVTIPSVLVTQDDGNLFKTELFHDGGDESARGAGVNATIRNDPNAPPDRDSDLDNGVIAHEYGHGISNRLTGGPTNTGCLFGGEQAGEGWSDFWTVVLSARASDNPFITRGVGTYVTFEGRDGGGIRNFPYTVDLGVNPQTYIDIGSTNVPHGVGEIWMAMVWEMYWELVARYGHDDDVYTGSGGNNLTIQLVVDGMKLQPCGPTFVSARDAILLADMNNNAGANQCEIWRAFAKRGLGVNATTLDQNVGNEVEDFTIPPECRATPNYMFFDGFESGDTSRWQ